jgi:nickel-dependent lactate racemase
VVTLGEVPAEFVKQASEGKVDYAWPAQVNKLLAEGGHDLILSIGQIVPHEVIGMANYNKNIFVGTGGAEGINKSHFLGAAYGMERIMGRANNPVRSVLNYASDHFANHLPIVYVLTVIGKGGDGGLAVKGLFIGDDAECFEAAAELSLQVNFEMLD